MWEDCVPDAVQRETARKIGYAACASLIALWSGAPLIRDLREGSASNVGVRNGPGSAAHHYVLRCARDTPVFPTLRSAPATRQPS